MRRDLIEAHIALRERGAEILAIYHSHPRWEAVPSKTDLAENHYGPVSANHRFACAGFAGGASVASSSRIRSASCRGGLSSRRFASDDR